MRRGVKLLACWVLAVSFLFAGTVPANAQLQNLIDLLIPPKPAPAPPAPAAPVPAPAPASASTSSTAQSSSNPANRGVFPLVVPNFRRSPPRSTALLFQRLQALADKGIPIDRSILKVAAPFPVAGQAKFTDDWLMPRWTPVPHLHQGTDVFANFGTPVITSESGKILTKSTGGAGGIAVWVTGDSGTAYYYAHLQSWVKGLTVGQRVEKGTIIGFVGNTGNAQGGPPHLHFETHPGYRGSPGHPGSPARDPKPFLDDALRQAEDQALALAQGAGVSLNEIGVETPRVPLLVIHKKVDKLLQSSSLQNPADLMWFSVLDPTLGVLGLARQSAEDAGLPAAALSEADAREENRMDIIRTAVASPKTRLDAFVNDTLFKKDAVVVGPVGLALASSLTAPDSGGATAPDNGGDTSPDSGGGNGD